MGKGIGRTKKNDKWWREDLEEVPRRGERGRGREEDRRDNDDGYSGG